MKRAAALGLVALYALGFGVSALFVTNPTDLDAFFLPSARIAAAGHPLTVYSVRLNTGQAPYANANGPLSLVPLTALAWLGDRLGSLGRFGWDHYLAIVFFALVTVWMASEALRAIDRLRGRRLRGWWRLVAYIAIAASPIPWLGEVGYGHIEQPLEIGLILLAVRTLVDGQPGRAGIGLGLSMLARTSAIVYLVPLAGLVLVRRGPVAALRLIGASVLTVALAMAPFLIADRSNVIFSLITSRRDLPVGVGSVWRLTVGGPYEQLAQHADTIAVLVAVLVLSLALLAARPRLQLAEADVYGVLAVVGLCFPLLAKAVWPYYFLEPYVFAVVWWLAGTGRHFKIAWLGPAFLTVASLVADYAAESTDPSVGLRESTVMALVLTGFTLLFAGRVAWPKRESRSAQPMMVGR